MPAPARWTRPRRARVRLAALLLAAAPALAQEPAEPVLGESSTIAAPSTEALEPVLLEAGARVWREPDLRSDPLAMIDAPIEVTPLETRGAWVRIRYGGVSGWVIPGGESPPLPEAGPEPVTEAPPVPIQPQPPAVDPERLGRALELLDFRGEPDRAGPFAFYSDLPDGALRTASLDVATRLPDGYRERFGLAPGVDRELAVILFADEEAYRAYADQEGELSVLGAMGHAGHGIAALSADRPSTAPVLSLLIHELTHLLNRDTLGRATPPWIEEGMANDLAFNRLGPNGRLLLGTLGGVTRLGETVGRDRFGGPQYQNLIVLQGPIASLSQLQRANAEGRLLHLGELTDLTWHEFVRREGRELRYIQSTFLVRYLLDGERGARADGFRGYLQALASGREAGPAALLEALGGGWTELERGYRRWLRSLTGGP